MIALSASSALLLWGCGLDIGVVSSFSFSSFNFRRSFSFFSSSFNFRRPFSFACDEIVDMTQRI